MSAFGDKLKDDKSVVEGRDTEIDEERERV